MQVMRSMVYAPMFQMKHLAYLAFYRYFIGREGQSMSGTNRKKKGFNVIKCSDLKNGQIGR